MPVRHARDDLSRSASTPTINSLRRELESRGIVKESTGRARDRVYVYRRYLEALSAEEEATPPGDPTTQATTTR
jgi:hypothetical protein